MVGYKKNPASDTLTLRRDAMNIKYEMVVDFSRPYKNHTVLVMQNDHLSRICHFVLKSNGKDLDVSDVATYTFVAVKPDSSKIYDSGTLDVDEDGNQLNEITYSIPQALTDVIGTCTCSIALRSDDGALLQSFEFYIRARNELKEEDDDSEDDLAGFRDILNRAAEAIEKIETISNKSRLPNPYALRLTIGDTTYTYDGSDTLLITMSEIAYLGPNRKSAPVIDVDWS